MKSCIIYETLENVQTMKVEKTKNGLMKLSGVFGVCGVVNNNKRIYEKNNYAKMVHMLQERIGTDGVPGELEHPDSMNINLANVSHKIDKIEIDENGVVTGTITLLNTPNGKIAQAIVEGGIPLFVSSRARGQVSKTGQVTLEELATYDLVGTPGFSQAKMHIDENRIVESINESIFYITDDNKENEKNNSIKNMTEEKLLEKIELLEREINSINKVTEEKNKLQEKIDLLERKINSINKDIDKGLSENKSSNESIKKWIIEEYSPVIEHWIEKNFSENKTKKVNVNENKYFTKDEILNCIVPGIQDWIVNEYSKGVQDWIVNEYSKGVQDWMVNEYSKGVQDWMVNEYSKGVQDWIVNEYSPVVDKWTKSKIDESKSASLNSIDETLALLENSTKKPKYGKVNILTEEVSDNEPKYIRDMPLEFKAKWNIASESVKESIKRKAKISNLVSEESIIDFWNNVSFEEKKDSNLFESLDNIKDQREKAIRAQIRKMNNKY